MGRTLMGIETILLLFEEYSVPMYETNDVAFIDKSTPLAVKRYHRAPVRPLRVASTGHEDVCKLFIGPHAKSTPLLSHDRSSVSSNQFAL